MGDKLGRHSVQLDAMIGLSRYNMGHMRRVAVLLGFLAVIAVTPRVYANEGRISAQNGPIRCEGISIWDHDHYRVYGRCQGLVYPYGDQLDNYVFWIVPDSGGAPVRIQDIDRGTFDGSTDQRFSSFFVTAESSSTPYQPGSVLVLSGSLSRFDFPPAYGNQSQEEQNTYAPPAIVSTAAAQTQPGVANLIFRTPGIGVFLGLAALGLVVIAVLFTIRR